MAPVDWKYISSVIYFQSQSARIEDRVGINVKEMPASLPLPGVACQAARRMLQLSQDELHELSGIAKKTINDVENDFANPRGSTLAELRAALEAAGAKFVAGEDYFGVSVALSRARFDTQRSPRRRAVSAGTAGSALDPDGAIPPKRRRGRPSAKASRTDT